MSSGTDARRRSGLWSYLSFSSAARRRTSVSLPTLSQPSTIAEDPYEKPNRHHGEEQSTTSSLKNEIQIAWMNQSQRSRFLKVGLVVFLVTCVILWLSPGKEYVEGRSPRLLDLLSRAVAL
jgi:guanosine-diphosphatase